jgi:hypothetical protein
MMLWKTARSLGSCHGKSQQPQHRFDGGHRIGHGAYGCYSAIAQGGDGLRTEEEGLYKGFEGGIGLYAR